MVTFVRPAWLALLAVVAALAAGYVLAQRRRPRYAVRFTNLDLLDVIAPDRPGIRRHIPAALVLGGVTALVVGLARPARTVEVAQHRGTIVVAVDVSPSMMATDVAPSRLAAARSAVGRFSDLLPSRIRLGLVTFAGTARVVVPPTSDRAPLRAALTQLRFRSETSLGEAIHAALDALAATGVADAAGIVILSDGASTAGRPDDEAAERARAAGVPVSTIAFGTSGGTVVLGGESVAVPPEPHILREIAEMTGGRFFAAVSEAELNAVYETVGRSVTTAQERREISGWFFASAFTLLIAASALSLAWFARFP
jgi:Ca-activated chloride channel family protein